MVQVERDGTLIEVPLDHVFNQRATQADVYDRAAGARANELFVLAHRMR